MINITLPDGSIKQYKKSITGLEIAKSISENLANEALAIKIQGKIGEQDRFYTVRECLDLMGFPKNYKIRDNYQQSYKQIGNSVCVKIVDRISKNIIQVLEQ